MALGKDFRDLESTFKRINEDSVEFSSNLKDITKNISDAAKGSDEFKQVMKGAADATSAAADAAIKAAGVSKESLKSQTELNKLNTKRAKLLEKEKDISARINKLAAYRINASKKEKDIIDDVTKNLSNSLTQIKGIVSGYDEILNTSKEIAKSNPFKFFSDLVSDIPIINKLLSNITAASQKYNDAIANEEGRTEALLKGTEEYFKLLSKAITVFVVKEAKDAIVFIDNSSKSLAANLGISRTQAIGLTQEFSDQAKELQGMAMTYKKIMEANMQLMTLAQVQTTFSKETASAFSVLTKNIGLSADVSEKLRSISVLTGSSLEDQVKDTMGLVRFNNQKFGIAVSEKTVMTEIASLSSNIAMSMAAQGKSLAASVYQAQKLGLSMQQIEKTAGSLLDFESSITNELEAELLIGRDLNLERARLAALNNDMGRVAEEINKQGITASSFKLMNSIQQNSIAKSLGMTASQMGDMFARQATFEKLGVSDLGGVAAIIADMRARGATDKEIQDRIGDKGMIDAARNLTMQEQIRDLIDNLATKVMPVLLKVLQALDFLLGKLGADGGNKVMKAGIQAIGLGAVAKMAGGARAAAIVARAAGGTATASTVGPNIVKGMGKTGAFYQNMSTGKFTSKAAFDASKAASTAAKGSRAASNAMKVGRFASKGLGRIAAPLALLGVGFDAYQNFTDESLSGGDAALKTLDQNKGLAAGTAIGAALAVPTAGVSMVVGPLIGGLADMLLPTIGTYGDEGLAEQKKTNELLLANNKQLMSQTQELYDAISRARSVSIDGDLMTSNSGIANTGGGRNIQ